MADYTELLCSLPHLQNPLQQAANCLSPVQMQKRLTMLLPDDRHALDLISHTFFWRNVPLNRSDEYISKQFHQMLALITDSQLHEWLQWRMDFRVLVAALRCRALNRDAATFRSLVTISTVGHILEQRWNQPAFGLAGAHPWLIKAESLLQQQQHLALEHLLLAELWGYLCRCEPVSPASFADVVLYVSRWDICLRLRQYNHQAGFERFKQLVTATLAANGIDSAEWPSVNESIGFTFL